MSNEISAALTLNVNNPASGGGFVSTTKQNSQFTQNAVGENEQVVLVPITPTAYTFSNLTTYGWMYLQNLDTTNYLDYGLMGVAIAAPVQTAPSQASTSGGTLGAGPYYYEVTAITTGGETTVSNEQNVSATAPPVQNNPTTSVNGGTLPANTYYYVVTALIPAGETAASNEKSITTTGTTSSNTITWSAVAGATGYRVYRGTGAGAENVFYAPGNVTTYVDTGAASTNGTPPSASTNKYTVNWNAVAGATGYNVYRGTAAGVENVKYSVGNVTTFTDTGAAGTAATPPTSNTTNFQPFGRLKAGEWAVARLTPGIAFAAKANTAPVNLLYKLFND